MNVIEMSAKASAARAAGNPLKVFDWVRAAALLRDSGAANAQAGLEEDWGHTSDTIWRDGNPAVDARAFLASLWATPLLRIGNARYECATVNPNWDADTVWPPEALAILEATS